MNIIWADMSTYVSHVVFRGIITQVFLSGALVFDVIVDNANGGSVVYLNWRWWLGVSKFGKSEMDDLGFLCIEKEGTQFGVGGRCGDEFEYHTHDVDGTVEFDRIAINRETAKEEVATSMALCTRGGEIKHIGVDVEYHVRGAVSYDGVGVHPHVIEELVDPSLGVFGWRRLLSGDVG